MEVRIVKVNIVMATMVPMVGLAQLDIFGWLTGAQGRAAGANLIGSLLVDLINALIGAIFQIAV